MPGHTEWPRPTVAPRAASDGLAQESRVRRNTRASGIAAAAAGKTVHEGPIPGDNDVVDMDQFGQILALDGADTSKEFSKALIASWMDQTDQTLQEMEVFLEAADIDALASRALYLKGSASSLGLTKVVNSCDIFVDFRPRPGYGAPGFGTSVHTPSTDGGHSGSHTPQDALAALPPVPRRESDDPPVDGAEDEEYASPAVLLSRLKRHIKEATTWLTYYYEAADARHAVEEAKSRRDTVGDLHA